MNALWMLSLDVDAVRADAGLAGVPELRRDRAVERRLQVGVLEHDERRVAAELERQALDLVGRRADEILADLGAAGEADLAHARVVEQHVRDVRRAAVR